MNEDLPHPGQRLRLARERLGLNQAQLAEQLRVTRGAVSAWESGLRRLEGPAVVALQALFGISSIWLLSGAGAMDVDPARGAGAVDLLRIPLIPDFEAWDAQGLVLLARLPLGSWPIPLPEAEKLLRESGGGQLADLAGLVSRPIVAPGLPRNTAHILNLALAVRRAPDLEGVYLFRPTPGDQPRFALLRAEGAGWIASPMAGDPGAPRLIGAREDLATFVLARVCASGWVWSRT